MDRSSLIPVRPRQRGRAFGVAQSGLLTAQGLGILIAGAAARWLSPPAAVAIAGALGVTTAAVLAAEWGRHRGTGPSNAAAAADAASPDGRAGGAGEGMQMQPNDGPR